MRPVPAPCRINRDNDDSGSIGGYTPRAIRRAIATVPLDVQLVVRMNPEDVQALDLAVLEDRTVTLVPGAAAQTAIDTLLASQRAWLAWRDKHPKTVASWRDYKDAAIDAVIAAAAFTTLPCDPPPPPVIVTEPETTAARTPPVVPFQADAVQFAHKYIIRIVELIEGADMLFLTAGMGGGTGTGAAPVIAKAAREMNILTVGVVTKPFLFEGSRRMRSADSGIVDLQQHVDTLIVIPNQNLFLVANPNTSPGVTDRLVASGRLVASAGTVLLPMTASYGVPYIATRAEAAIGSAAALDMLAERRGTMDAAIIAAFTGTAKTGVNGGTTFCFTLPLGPPPPPPEETAIGSERRSRPFRVTPGSSLHASSAPRPAVLSRP